MGLLLTIYMAESCFGNLEITNGQSTCEEREGVKNSGTELMKVKVLQILLQIRHVVIARDQTIHGFFFPLVCHLQNNQQKSCPSHVHEESQAHYHHHHHISCKFCPLVIFIFQSLRN